MDGDAMLTGGGRKRITGPMEPLLPRTHNGPPSAPRPALAQVMVTVAVEIGRASITLKDLRGLHEGQVIVLDRLIGAPLTLLANGQPVGLGVPVSINKERCGLRVTALNGQIPEDRA